jgi:hypothetical protein
VLSFETLALARDGDVGARKSAAEEIDGRESCLSGFADVGDGSIGIGPVSREDAPREVFDLDLPNDVTHAGPFQSELEKSDAREERSDSESMVPHGANRLC